MAHARRQAMRFRYYGKWLLVVATLAGVVATAGASWKWN
jgi:hypothetical protein